MPNYQPVDLDIYHNAITGGAIFLPDNRIVFLDPQEIARKCDEDVFADSLEVILEPEYEQRIACMLESLVNADVIKTSGAKRFYFIMQNLSEDRATGDFFGVDRRFIDRDVEETDWRKVRSICDVFPVYTGRYMHRLKDRIAKPNT